MIDLNSNLTINFDGLTMDEIDGQLSVAFYAIEDNRRDQMTQLLTQRNQRHAEIRGLLDICHGRVKA